MMAIGNWLAKENQAKGHDSSMANQTSMSASNSLPEERLTSQFRSLSDERPGPVSHSCATHHQRSESPPQWGLLSGGTGAAQRHGLHARLQNTLTHTQTHCSLAGPKARKSHFIQELKNKVWWWLHRLWRLLNTLRIHTGAVRGSFDWWASIDCKIW